MAKEEIQKEQEIVQDVKNGTPTETQKSPEEFLQQINNISIVPTNTKNVSKQVSVNTDNNSSSNQNNSNSSSVSDNLGVRIVKKNSLDGDVNADLRDPMSSSTQARVVEKNNLVGNVVADLREPTYEHKDEMPKIEHKATTPPPEGLLTLSSVHVNEGSPYALFTVNGKPNEFVSLGLSGQNSDGHNLSTLEYFNGNSWVSYISGNINLDSSGKVLVRVSLSPEQERELDGVETFNLIATNRDGLSATGTGSIHDDGTGSYFASNNNSETSNIPNGVVLDDDRPLIINNVSVNEASTYAVFEITGAAEQKASLDLQNGTTTGLNALEYFDGTSWVSYTSGNVNLDSNGKLLVRVILSPEQERIQDNGETFTLTATNTGGTSVIGTGTIHDDGTGNYYPDNTTGNPYSPTELINHSITLDDDRALSVNNISVNEGSPYAVFTVSGVSGQNVKLELTSGTATLEIDTHNAGTNVSLQYYNGSSWVDYTANSYVAIPDGGTTLLVRTAITNDSTYEGAEIFTLTATNTGGTSVIGTGTIHDDGTGNYYPDNTTGNPYSPTELINHNITLDDDRGIGVTSLGDVNENSSYAMFVVQSNAGQTLTLGLSNGTATLSNETIQFSYDGTHWTTYYNSTLPIVPENGKFYVRNTISSEVDSSYEGSENFSLVVTNSVNTSISGRDSTNIKDDGTGNKFTGNITDPTNNTPATSNITLDDDRVLSVNNISVNEGSPYAVFTISGATGQLIKLSLLNGTARGGTTTPTDGSIDYGTNLQYLQGNSWVNYTPNSYVAISTGTTLLVRTTIVNDTLFEAGHNFTLTATNTGGISTPATQGIATIYDDGTGNYYPDNTTGNPYSSIELVNHSITLDDDRALSVNNISVNEGSPYAVFTVSGVSGQNVKLELTSGTATLEIDTHNAGTNVSLQYYNGSSWVDYTANSYVAIPDGGTTLLVRTAITNDSTYEGVETFTLTATNTGGTSVIGTGTIHDDGTGNYYPDNTTGNPYSPTELINHSITLDDDRALSVNSISVNENSPFAVFTVTAVAGQSVKLIVADGTTNGAMGNSSPSLTDGTQDYNSNLYYYDSTNGWTLYTPNSYVTIPTSGNLLVGTYVVQDTLYEVSETFTLKAEYSNGKNSTGTATIYDNGSGQWFDGSSGTGSNTAPSNSVLDNDKPTLSINDVTVNELDTDVYAVFTVSLSNKSTQDIVFSLSSTAGTATVVADYTASYEVYLNGAWTSATSATIPAGSTSIQVRMPVIGDNILESDETFRLNATVTSGDTTNGSTLTFGTATIVDDDNGNHAPVAVNDSYSLNEGATLTGSNIITNDTDADSNTLTIYSVNGTLFTSLTDSTDSIYTSALGYKEVVTTNGKIYITSDGTVQYTHNGSETATDSFTYKVYDGFTTSNSATVSYTITPVNDAPVLDLDANNTTTTGYDFITSYALGKTGISIGDTDVSVTDIDNTNIASATITLTNAQAGDVLFAGDLPSGITVSSYDSSTGVITLTGSATKADYQKAIEAINFYNKDTNTTATPSLLNDRTITVVVNDGNLDSNIATTTIHVASNALNITTNPTVEEGKSAIFNVSLEATRSSDTKVYLTTAGTSTTVADYDAQFMYQSSPGVWTNVSSDSGGVFITIPAGSTSIEVKIKTINDGALVDDGESLILNGNISGGTNTDMANTTASATTIITEKPSLTVSAPSFTIEGNSAIFEVSLTNFKTSTTAVTLGISGDVTTSDYSTASYQYSTNGGISWTTVTGNVNGASITIPAGTTTLIPSILVKVTTLTDAVSDNLESMVLTATTADSGISSFGNSASGNTIIVEPLSLTATEQKDELGDAHYIAPITALANSTGTGFTYVKVNDGANGTVTQSGNNLIYTPNKDFSGTDTFSYQMINNTTGEVVTSVANVAVTAVADTPIITIGANVFVPSNLFATSTWYKGTSGSSMNAANDVTYSGTVYTSGTTVSLGNKDYIINVFNLSSGTSLNLTVTGGTPTAYWAYYDGVSSHPVTYLSAVGSYSGSITVPTLNNGTLVANTLILANGTVSSIDLKQAIATNTAVYNVNIYDALTDSDNASTGSTNVEQLQNVRVVVKDSTNTVINSSTLFNQGTYTSSDGSWSFTQAQLSNLKITISTTNATNGVSIIATATSMELSNSSTATNTATILIKNSDDTPTIGDKTLTVTNAEHSSTVNTVATTYIDTKYSTNGTNVFSWDVAKTQIPELYANGQKVVITFDNVNHTVTGTIDNGSGSTTTIFTTTISMANNNGTTLNYTQGNSLLGVVNKIDGDIILPGGGNQDYRIFQFTKSASDSTVAVDALVAAHNLIEDTYNQINNIGTGAGAEHTVNTNNYYIGVDSNNMNAGQQLVFDFATVATYDGITTHKNEVSEINIKLFNFDSGKSGDELYITVLTAKAGVTYNAANSSTYIKENILLTQNSDYSTDLQYTVHSATGNPIVAVEFLAGNNSSFKLGIESIGSISYNDTFQMKYAYDISDTDTSSVGVLPSDTDTGTTTIQVGSGTVNTSLDYVQDSKIVFDATDRVIDGGAGIDTLVLGTGINIDFSNYTNSINNIEKIDMTNSATTNSLSHLKASDIFNMTDSNHLLTILGDGNGASGTSDNVTLDNSAGTWSAGSTANGYTTYTSTYNSNAVTLKIDTDIHVI